MRLSHQLRGLLDTQRVYVTRSQLNDCGMTREDTDALLRAGQLRKVRRGIYARTTQPDSDAARSLDRARGISITYGGDALVSHEVALLAHELPTYATGLRRATLVRLTGGDTVRTRDVHIRRTSRALPSTHIDAAPVVTEAIAFAQVACALGTDAAVVAGDAILHRGSSSIEDLREAVRTLSPTRGIARARVAIGLLDENAESPGETQLRLLALGARIPLWSQFVVRDVGGKFVARVDFLIKGTRIVLEYDGHEKYDTREQNRNEGAQRLYDEKLRQESVERQGYVVMRATATDLRNPGPLLHRLHRLIAEHTAQCRVS
ncbi:MAG: type IV toxin-antitoxin system AbiEi family antitoxin domain-containing protein [Cumulibacter sp.]